MYTLASTGCTLPSTHPSWATAGAVLFILAIVTYCARILYCTRKAAANPVQEGSATGRDGSNSQGQTETTAEKHSVYDLLQPHAKDVKAVCQMAIGLITVIAVAWQYLDTLGGGEDPIKLLLKGTGIGLAAAAALELSYTLFTDGPDEALDPLMLGLSSTLLLNVAGLSSPPTWSQAGVLAVLALILIGLFAARLMLGESTDQQSKIWWIARLNTREK